MDSKQPAIDTMYTPLTKYNELDHTMVKAAWEDEGSPEVVTTARLQLQNADLPLRLRARACLMLCRSAEPDFLERAKEAFRIAQFGCDLSDNPGEERKKLLEISKCDLLFAQQRFDEMHAGGNVPIGQSEEEAQAEFLDNCRAIVVRGRIESGKMKAGDGSQERKVDRLLEKYKVLLEQQRYVEAEASSDEAVADTMSGEVKEASEAKETEEAKEQEQGEMWADAGGEAVGVATGQAKETAEAEKE